MKKTLTTLGFTLAMMCVCSYAYAQKDTTQVTDFTIDEQNITLMVGESFQLHVNPANAKVKWISGAWDFTVNPVSVVDQNGLVTALKAGKSYVAVESLDGSSRKQTSVTVLDQGAVRTGCKQFEPTTECEWNDMKFTLTDEGSLIAQGTFYGSGAKNNQLNYTVSDQCIFLWFEIDYSDSTMNFYPQPFTLEINDCNAPAYNIYLNNRTQVLESNNNFASYSIRRGTSTDGTTNTEKSECPYIYGYDADYSYYVPKVEDIYPILLYPLSDEITVQKRSDIDKDSLEVVVREYLPDAQFEWSNISGLADFCLVITESGNLDYAIENLLDENAVSFASKNYIRKTYKDLMDLYPVNKVATYCFTGDISFRYINNVDIEANNQADALMESMGLEIYYQGIDGGSAHIQKGMDIIAIANQLQESGCFRLVSPSFITHKKTLPIQPIDKTTLPFYYLDNGDKKYLYEVVDRFMVRINPSTNKSLMESIIKRYVEESDIIWNNDSDLTVFTNPENVERAMNALLMEDLVIGVSHKYLDISDYEFSLREGLTNPKDFGLDGIEISFKKEVTNDDKLRIINDFNLNLVEELERIRYALYEVPKTMDVLSVCRSLYETGYLKYATPHTTQVYQLIFWSSTTDVKTADNEPQEIGIKYYDLLGSPMDSPSGLTIVVTYYSDGTVRTEKKLFK